jgi:hypothetical protein
MNKTEYLKQIVSSMVDEFENGNVSALDLYIELKSIENFVGDHISNISDDALSDAEQYGKGEHIRNGVIFAVRNGAGRWDFKHVPEWNAKKKEIETIETGLKSLYNLVQANPGQYVNTDTGEVPTLPAYNKSKDSLMIKFPKIKS